eukprot:scaffold3871_cov97-Isochrysis_galbana.AAC.3
MARATNGMARRFYFGRPQGTERRSRRRSMVHASPMRALVPARSCVQMGLSRNMASHAAALALSSLLAVSSVAPMHQVSSSAEQPLHGQAASRPPPKRLWRRAHARCRPAELLERCLPLTFALIAASSIFCE